MVAGYAPRLAVDEYVRVHGLRPLGPVTRELSVGPAGGTAAGVVTVLDAAGPAG